MSSKKRTNGIKKGCMVLTSPRMQCFECRFSTLIILIPTILVSGSTVCHKFTIVIHSNKIHVICQWCLLGGLVFLRALNYQPELLGGLLMDFLVFDVGLCSTKWYTNEWQWLRQKLGRASLWNYIVAIRTHLGILMEKSIALSKNMATVVSTETVTDNTSSEAIIFCSTCYNQVNQHIPLKQLELYKWCV